MPMPQVPRCLDPQLMNARRMGRSRPTGAENQASLQGVDRRLKPAPCSLAVLHGVLPPSHIVSAEDLGFGYPAQFLPPPRKRDEGLLAWTNQIIGIFYSQG
jgi:hypothetical protein